MKAEEFDKRFDNGEIMDEYVDYTSPLSDKDLNEILGEKITINLTGELKEKLNEKAKKLGVQIQDLIKILLAKDVGLI